MNELFRIKDALANIGKIVDKTDNEFTDSLAAEVYEANDALNTLADKLVCGNKQTDSGLSKQEENIISGVALTLSFCVNYIKVLANRETDEREEIINVCDSMKKELKKLMPLLGIEIKEQD